MCLICVQYAQTEVSGRIFNLAKGNPPLPLSKIEFSDIEDSANTKFVTFSDFKGMYYFESLIPKKYYVNAKYNGELVAKGYNVIPESDRAPFISNFSNKITIKTIPYRSSNIPVSINSSNTTNIFVLIQSHIPEVLYDFENKILTHKNRKVILFLNGLYLKKNEIDKINIRNIQSIDIYDISNLCTPHMYSCILNLNVK